MDVVMVGVGMAALVAMAKVVAVVSVVAEAIVRMSHTPIKSWGKATCPVTRVKSLAIGAARKAPHAPNTPNATHVMKITWLNSL